MLIVSGSCLAFIQTLCLTLWAHGLCLIQQNVLVWSISEDSLSGRDKEGGRSRGMEERCTWDQRWQNGTSLELVLTHQVGLVWAEEREREWWSGRWKEKGREYCRLNELWVRTDLSHNRVGVWMCWCYNMRLNLGVFQSWGLCIGVCVSMCFCSLVYLTE